MAQFLVSVEHTQGEHEFTHYGLCTADTWLQAIEKSKQPAIEWFAYPDEVSLGDTEYCIDIKGASEISAEEAAILLKHGVVVNMDEKASDIAYPDEEEEDEDEEDETAYTNYFMHCRTQWTDQWSCMCNDRCPECNHEIEPYKSERKEDDKMIYHVAADWVPEDGWPEGCSSRED
jgi:hypothetical protein